MFVGYFFTSLIYILLISSLVLNFLAQKNYVKGKTVIINNPSPVCIYGNNIEKVNINSLNPCKDKKGNIIPDYYTYSINGLKFVVTDKLQSFYTTICNKFCGGSGDNNLLLTNGNCKNPSSKYTFCLELLEPPKNCKNPEQAIFVDFEGKPYFANDIFPSKYLNCLQD